MDSEKLIECVREFVFLYDCTDKRYSDNNKKDAAWDEIGKALQVDGKDCKKNWTLLRDCYRRAIKKQKETRSGQENAPVKKWKYQDEMSFLLPYFKERPTLCTLQVEDDSGGQEDHLEQNTRHPVSPNDISTSSSIASVPARRPTEMRNRRKRLCTEETPSAVLMKYILENKNNTDDIDKFFTSIAATVKSFPPREKALAKAKVFEIISKMEIDILSNPSSSSNNASQTSVHCNLGSAEDSFTSLAPTDVSQQE